MARITSDPPLALKAPPEHLSWSQVTKLSPRYRYACARQWGYDKLAGLPFESSPALAAGSAYDEALNALLNARIQGHPEGRALEWALRAAREEWVKQAARLTVTLDEDRDAAYQSAVQAAVSRFARERLELVPSATQTKHGYSVQQHDGQVRTVVGWSDRIDPDGTIVDHKYSGSARWTGNEWQMDWISDKVDQLVVYWLARRAEERRGVPQPAPVTPRGRLEVMFMRVDMKTPQLRAYEAEFSEEDELRVLGAIREAHDIQRAGRLPARPGPACDFCSYQQRCRSDEERRGARFAEVVGTT